MVDFVRRSNSWTLLFGSFGRLRSSFSGRMSSWRTRTVHLWQRNDPWKGR